MSVRHRPVRIDAPATRCAGVYHESHQADELRVMEKLWPSPVQCRCHSSVVEHLGHSMRQLGAPWYAIGTDHDTDHDRTLDTGNAMDGTEVRILAMDRLNRGHVLQIHDGAVPCGWRREVRGLRWLTAAADCKDDQQKRSGKLANSWQAAYSGSGSGIHMRHRV